jgi:hypothetical protein
MHIVCFLLPFAGEVPWRFPFAQPPKRSVNGTPVAQFERGRGERAAVREFLILWEKEACHAARASIPRVLQLSVRRRSGEAIGGMRNESLSGHRTGSSILESRRTFPEARCRYSFSYVLGLLSAGHLAFPPPLVYPTPLPSMSRGK